MVTTTVSGMIGLRERLRRPLGLVPTMGYLHEGHLALVRRARHENQTVVATIFVNPAQFGPSEDYATYPRDTERDLKLLGEEGVDAVFVPPVEEIYAPGHRTYVDVEGFAARLEGAHRPGHFRGVATVVTKLFTIVRPDTSYFGQKDGQQAIIIKRLNADLNLGTRVVVVPTVREPDGLALSSRNVYLSPEERRAAPVLYEALRAAKETWRKGETSGERLRQAVRDTVGKEPRVELEYVSVADAETLEELCQADRPAMVSLAARLGSARLIDNVILSKTDETQ